MAGHKRGKNTNDVLKEKLNIFKDIVNCLEDIIEESDNGKSATQICKEYNIDFLKLRGFLNLKSLEKIYIDENKKFLSYKDIELSENPYEVMYRAIFDIDDNTNVEYPVDLADSIEYVMDTNPYIKERQRVRTIIQMRFGLGEYYPMKMNEIAEELNCSNARIGQILAKSLRIFKYNKYRDIIVHGLAVYKLNEEKQKILTETNKSNAEKHLAEYKRNIHKFDDRDVVQVIIDEAAYINISDLGFTARTLTVLSRVELFALSDLIIKTDDKLLKIRGLGDSCLREIYFAADNFLSTYGMNRQIFLEQYNNKKEDN